MILFYIDESGSLDSPSDHFVVGGLAIHEADVRGFNRSVEMIAARYLDPHLRGIELHAHAIRTGRGPWGRVPGSIKNSLLRDIPALLGGFRGRPGYALFAVARAPASVPAVDPLERTFEELLLRFTQMLIRLGSGRDSEMGIVIADEAKYETTLQPLVQKWRTVGTRFAKLSRLAEVPLFIDSKATRLTQAADFVAHGVYRHYTAGDASLFSPMLRRFDIDGGKLHGLVHLRRDYTRCPCPACVSRTMALRIARAAPAAP